MLLLLIDCEGGPNKTFGTKIIEQAKDVDVFLYSTTIIRTLCFSSSFLHLLHEHLSLLPFMSGDTDIGIPTPILSFHFHESSGIIQYRESNRQVFLFWVSPMNMIGLEHIPSDVWNTHLTPCLDRRDWNAVRVASKPFYHQSELRAIVPPWPQRCYGGTAPSIASFSISYDGEYMAAGSMIGSIEIWNRRKGRISHRRKKGSSSSGGGNHPSFLSNRCQPPSVGGSIVLKFSPIDYTLASGHENRIFLQYVSDNMDRREVGNPGRILEIQCHHGTIYEITYLGFSQDATRLIARYGKTAYIWRKINSQQTTTTELFNYSLIHTLPLSSSRCQMTSSLSMNFLAVTNASYCDDKGTIDVWNMGHLRPGKHLLDPDTSGCCFKMAAHPKQVIRGLEFVPCYDKGSSSSTMDDNAHILVSATLQGEIKFWQFDRHYASQSDIDAAFLPPPYYCTRSFHVAGKIFSLALFVPTLLSSSSSGYSGSISQNVSLYLAVGQSRGQVRAWKINLGMQETKRAVASNRAMANQSTHHQNTTTTTKRYRSSNDLRQEFLSVELGEHVRHDNIKLLSFTPDGRVLVASRAYDARIWFQTVWCW
jgi:WD40 repeat protein